MTTAMGPPPPRNPTSSSTTDPELKTLDESSSSSSEGMEAPMAAPPPKNASPANGDSPQVQINSQEEQSQENPTSSDVEEPIAEASDNSASEITEKPTSEQSQSAAVPYTIPSWSASPCHHFFLEVLKDGSIVDQFDVYEKGAYMFGRVDLCDFVLEHPTISRFHAVIQFKSNGDAYLYDLGSSHGTSINKNQVKKRVYVDLRVGDVIRFGHSSRLYIFQGPADLMPPEADLKIIRGSKIREEMLDRDASLRRAKVQASLADGISWGMSEDAEEVEDEADEVTWQTYKGPLTEKQEKTREKVLKRTEKIAHMKKEIDAIRVKDIAQGGLTQGQQTQIARNEQRIAQIIEELENLEETLNESIQESLGARTGRISRGRKQGATEDDEELSSDDDEFYDRTQKKPSNKAGDNQSVETADTLLDKRDAIMKEMEDKKEAFSVEKNKIESNTAVESEDGDALDAYMSGLSSQLVLDKTKNLQNELSLLQSELDRVLYLLKIADPTGEASKRRDPKLEGPKPKLKTPTVVKKQPPTKPTRTGESVKLMIENVTYESSKEPDAGKSKTMDGAKEGKATSFTIVKPQWLGAVGERKAEETEKQEVALNMQEVDKFVDYKDRNKILESVNDKPGKLDSGIENAAPGLILRKRKEVERSEDSFMDSSQQSTSSSGDGLKAEDAVALLLKHKRGYHGEEEEIQELQNVSGGKKSKKNEKKPKRVLGPEKPSFLDVKADYESWVPPEGQSGDGRTSLNERFGY